MVCSTLKQGCQAGIKIKLSEDKQMLVVMEIEEDHNHLVEKVQVHVYMIDIIVNTVDPRLSEYLGTEPCSDMRNVWICEIPPTSHLPCLYCIVHIYITDTRDVHIRNDHNPKPFFYVDDLPD